MDRAALQDRGRRVDTVGVQRAADRLSDNVVTFIVVARHGGMSYARIASLMNRIELPTARGGQWHGSTVARVAKVHMPHASQVRTRRAG